MTTLPLTRSKHLVPFSRLLQKAGEPVGPLLRRSRLPFNCLADPQTLVPSEAAFRFRSLAARNLGLTDLALEATRNLEVADLGAFAKPLFRAPTLFRLLTEFRDRVNTETTMAVFQMNQNESGDVLFCHRFHHAPERDVWHSDLYVLQWTIKIVRLVDPDWSPGEVWSVSPAAEDRYRTMETLGVQTTAFGQHCTGFWVPSAMLALPLKCADDTNDREEGQLATTDPAETFCEAIAQVIRSYSSDRWLAIEEVADVIAMSTRTLQRRLSAERTTFRTVFDRTRSEVAGELLETTDLSIAQIARRLGYKDQANLTRAFKRWSGVPPSVYRQQRVAGGP